MAGGLETRVLVPTVRPTEFVHMNPERLVEVAQWLAERGISIELHFDGRRPGSPQLWRRGSMGPTTVEAGAWLGVRDGVFQGEFTDEQLATWRDAKDGAS